MILIKFNIRTNHESQNNLINSSIKTGISYADFSWNLVNFVSKDFSKLLEGKSDEFCAGFKTCVEEFYRNELIKMSD